MYINMLHIENIVVHPFFVILAILMKVIIIDVMYLASTNYKTYLRNINLTMFFILVESLEDGTVKTFMKICGEQML